MTHQQIDNTVITTPPLWTPWQYWKKPLVLQIQLIIQCNEGTHLTQWELIGLHINQEFRFFWSPTGPLTRQSHRLWSWFHIVPMQYNYSITSCIGAQNVSLCIPLHWERSGCNTEDTFYASPTSTQWFILWSEPNLLCWLHLLSLKEPKRKVTILCSS